MQDRSVVEMIGDEKTPHWRRIQLIDQEIAKLRAENQRLAAEIDKMQAEFGRFPG